MSSFAFKNNNIKTQKISINLTKGTEEVNEHYHNEVQLFSTKKKPQQNLKRINTNTQVQVQNPVKSVAPPSPPVKIKPIVIIQNSPPHTASTVLINLLHGFIQPTKPVYYYQYLSDKLSLDNSVVNIIKTHILDINKLTEIVGNEYDVYFVCSERDDKKINSKFKNMKNVLLFDYTELNETSVYDVNDIVNNAFKKLRPFIPSYIKLDRKAAIERINNMNKLYEKIKDKPFSYVDMFYHIHGSHRGRNILNNSA